MRLHEAFPSTYLKHADLQGRAFRVTIKGYSIEEIGQGADKDTKPVLAFRQTAKKLVLNRTNANAIAEVYGDDLDAWDGKLIELYPDRTGFGGKMVDCLRVRVPLDAVKPPAKTAPPAEEPGMDDAPPLSDDDIPF
jgi:hypothetical protein